MKLKSILFILMFSVAAAACVGEKGIKDPMIATSDYDYVIPADGGQVQLTFISNMPWSIKVTPGNANSDIHDVKVSPTSGVASYRPITVTVKAGANPNKKRVALISILGSDSEAAVRLTQAGAEDGTVQKGTVANPYPANELLALMKGGEVPTGDVCLRGIVSKVGSIDVSSYHNATFWLTDDGTHPASSDNDAFQVFRAKDYALSDVENAEIVKLGDVVTVLGPLTIYAGSGGNVYETQANKAQILAVNGMGTPYGDGTAAETPYNVGKAMSRIAETGETSTEEVFVKGVVAGVKEINVGYGNATYWITDDGYMPASETSALQVFRGKSFNGESFTDPEALKVGDEVVIKGTLVNYKSNTPEVNTGSVLISLNGKTE